VLYADTSAMAKLLRSEPETAAARRYLRAPNHQPVLSSELVVTELHRVALRQGPAAPPKAQQLLAGLELRKFTRRLLDHAGQLGPPTLPSLDAIHLATALEFAGELAALVTYDRRLAEAARSHGLHVESPA
jgi:predicted nucleic acid-binding protein